MLDSGAIPSVMSCKLVKKLLLEICPTHCRIIVADGSSISVGKFSPKLISLDGIITERFVALEPPLNGMLAVPKELGTAVSAHVTL